MPCSAGQHPDPIHIILPPLHLSFLAAHQSHINTYLSAPGISSQASCISDHKPPILTPLPFHHKDVMQA